MNLRKDNKPLLFLSFSLTLGLGLILMLSSIAIVRAVDVDVTAEVPAALCGNGVVEGSENCDDGNTTTEGCNDSVIQSGTYCNSNCTIILNLTETCDPPNAVQGSCNTGYFCNNSCNCQQKGSICIPGAVTCSYGPCVGGSQSGLCGNGCSFWPSTISCYVPACGNGTIDSGEECDDGNTTTGDGCSAACQIEQGCGDGDTDLGEECDDGNIVSGDCCSATCQNELLITNVGEAVTNTTATISWSTLCQATNSLLEWGLNVSLGDGSVSLSGQNYSYTITGLQPNTVYYYRITATAGGLQATYNDSFLTTGGVENCTNSIDDDNDGLIDYLDSECFCEAIYDCTDWAPAQCPESGTQTRDCIWVNSGVCWNNEPLEPISRSCVPECQLTCGPCQNLNIDQCICEDIAVCCGNDICEPPTEDPYTCLIDCPVTCLSEWDCTDWLPEPCPLSGIQARDCFDINACEIPINQPPLQRSCSDQCPGLFCGACQAINIEQCTCEELIPCCGNGYCESGETHEQCPQDCVLPCTPNWTCLAWGPCRDSVQRRECYDLNNCDLNLDRPPEVRSCEPGCDVACSICQVISLDTCSCLATTPCCGNRTCEEQESVWSCPVDCGLPPELRITLTQCLDGLDNDNDGLVDYPTDPGCSKPSDVSELNFIELLLDASRLLREKFLDNPAVEQLTKRVAAPTIITIATVNTFATFSFFNLLSYLRYLLSQPLAALFRRRRKKWGVVYNSLSKQPVDLAIVRLYQQENSRLVQSRVTDKVGRYNFIAAPGRYYITVTKPNYDFPTQILKDKKEDIKYLDLYHGEIIEVKEDRSVITLNIPLDPKQDFKPAFKVVFQYYLRKVQYTISFSAVPLAALSMVISPGALTFSLFGFHCLLYVLFRRLGYQKPPKSWGIIYDKGTKKAIGRAITRIYDKQYNKLLETRVTDPKGRYAFLVDNNIYYLTAEKSGYRPERSPDIDLVSKEREAMVGFDIGLEKGKGEIPAVPPTTPPIQPSKPVAPMTQPSEPIKPSEPIEAKPAEPPIPVTPKPSVSIPSVEKLEEKVEDLGVSRESLEELLKSKKSIEEIKEEVAEKKEELTGLEEKIEKIEDKIEHEIEEKKEPQPETLIDKKTDEQKPKKDSSDKSKGLSDDIFG